MSLKNKLYELATTDDELMVAIEDVKTFHLMTVDKKLRVTDPIAYEEQNENLRQIRNKYKDIISEVIMENFDALELILSDTLNDIAGGSYLTFRANTGFGPITANQITCS